MRLAPSAPFESSAWRLLEPPPVGMLKGLGEALAGRAGGFVLGVWGGRLVA
jgi:hypothetical protein